MTRQQYLAWCKQRALGYLPGDPRQALAGMLSDLRKHPETADHVGLALGALMLQMMGGHLDWDAAVRDFIQGFN